MVRGRQAPHETMFPTHLFVQGHWFYLFHSLLALITLYPYLETGQETQRPMLLALMNSVVVVAIVYAVSFNIRQFILASFLGSEALVFMWFPDLFPYGELLSCVTTAILYIYAILRILSYFVFRERVDNDTIFAATSLYILLGMSWAIFYQAINIIYPGSFHLSDEHNLDLVLNWSDFLFFSFTTLTTLGYGDVTPVTSQARSLAILEAITGVIFMGVVVSRVIGSYVSRSIAESQTKND